MNPLPGSELRAQPAAGSPALPSSDAYARYVLGVLFTVYVVSYIDRQLLAVLLQPIKEELRVSDTAMGLLTGVAFAIFYVIAGIPIARLADRSVRRTIIAAGVAFWSAMTALTGLSQSYAHILLARIGVGAGEAAGGAPAHALIADYFPPHQRATALGILTTGGGVGITLGLVLGGWLGEHFGWRTAFLTLGPPGLAVALLVRLTVREPERGRFETLPFAASQESMRQVVRHLWALRSFRHLALAATLHVFAGFGASNWQPTFLVRVHGLHLSETGLWLGLVSGVCAAVGMIVGGRIADRLGRGDPRWYMWVPAVGTTVAMPFSYLFILWSETYTALGFLVVSALLGACYTGPTFAMTQALARPRMRATAAALLFMLMNLLGLGLGPFAVGVLNDALEPRFGAEAVRYSLLIIGLPHVVAAVLNVLAARTLRQDLQRAGVPDLVPQS